MDHHSKRFRWFCSFVHWNAGLLGAFKLGRLLILQVVLQTGWLAGGLWLFAGKAPPILQSRAAPSPSLPLPLSFSWTGCSGDDVKEDVDLFL